MSAQDEWNEYLRKRFGIGPTKLAPAKEEVQDPVKWEPIVRDLLDHRVHDDLCNYWHGWGDTICDCGHDAAWERAEAALGET